jgi:hypothetical protein
MIQSLWAMCRFRFRGPFLVLEYSDSDGTKGTRYVIAPDRPHFEDIRDPLRGLIARLGKPAPTGAPLALFFSFPRSVELPAIRDAFKRWLRDFPRIQPVELSRARPLERPPIRLPLSILSSPELELDSQLRVGDESLAKFSVRVHPLAADLEMSLRISRYSIVVLDRDLTAAEEHMLRRLPETDRPRLLICVRSARVPSLQGIVVLRANEEDADLSVGVVRAFFSGIFHDLPLHWSWYQAYHELDEEPGTLIADPFSNESLRLSGALRELKRQADRVLTRFPAFEQRFPTVAQQWRESGATERMLGLRNMNSGSFLAQHGLESLAQAVEGLEAIRSTLGSAIDLPVPADQTDQAPDTEETVRRLDASLSRVDTPPALSPVRPNQSLQAGAAYELRIHIGYRFPESLVTGDVGAIEDVVGAPDDESGGHRLQISIQGKDFRVLSESTQPLLLPRTGSTELLYFRVRAPEEHGKRLLRITVHHRNHLIQSFLLTAHVAESERAAGEILIKQEFARSTELTNLDELKERDLFLGMNQGQSTHQIMVVADNASSELDLGARAYTQAVQDLRQALDDAMVDPTNGLVRTYSPVAAGSPPSTEAAAAFRRLAQLGRAVYNALFSALPKDKTRAAIVGLQSSTDKTIQVVRFEAHSTFPWTLLYDWLTPDVDASAPLPPVCLGSVAPGQACSHGPKDRVYCVRGFWGVRHQVEELLDQQRNASQTVTKPGSDAILIAASPSLTQATSLHAGLSTACGAGNLASGPYKEDQLLDVLWQKPPARPAVLIVLGHLVTDKTKPNTPYVALQASEYFTLKHFTERATQDPDGWDDPRSIVIFAPCGGAAIDEDTLNGFVTALNTAGAGAVIGMQATVGDNQATEFAEKLTHLLWASEPLGVAMQKVRGEAVMAGDPGGFLLQSFGDIDLKLQ